jgi:hypothetical protein
MSFKFDPKAAEGRKYVSKAGTYDCTVEAVKYEYMPPRSDFYAKFTLVTAEGETTSADIFLKPEKNGEYGRLQQFMAASATKDEIDKYLSRGEFDIDEEFIRLIGERAVGRSFKVVVTERKYTRKDGTEGVAYNGSFFKRLPQGPDQPF